MGRVGRVRVAHSPELLRSATVVALRRLGVVVHPALRLERCSMGSCRAAVALSSFVSAGTPVAVIPATSCLDTRSIQYKDMLAAFPSADSIAQTCLREPVLSNFFQQVELAWYIAMDCCKWGSLWEPWLALVVAEVSEEEEKPTSSTSKSITYEIARVHSALNKEFIASPLPVFHRAWRYVLACAVEMFHPTSPTSRRWTPTRSDEKDKAAVTLCPVLDCMVNRPSSTARDYNVQLFRCHSREARAVAHQWLCGTSQVLAHSGPRSEWIVLVADCDVADHVVLQCALQEPQEKLHSDIWAYVCGM